MHACGGLVTSTISNRRVLSCAICVVLALLMSGNPVPLLADTYPRQAGVDAIHYIFRLALGDSNDEIAGDATITLRITPSGVTEVYLDLASSSGSKGMAVSAVQVDGAPVRHSHQADRLRIPLPSPVAPGKEIVVRVQYHGVPGGGLRLIKNIHGERTAFSENWPNRARQWLPMIDHPYDKATGEFIVTAPAH